MRIMNLKHWLAVAYNPLFDAATHTTWYFLRPSGKHQLIDGVPLRSSDARSRSSRENFLASSDVKHVSFAVSTASQQPIPVLIPANF